MAYKYNAKYDNAIGSELTDRESEGDNQTKFKVISLFIALIGLVAAMQVATENFADDLGGNIALGSKLSFIDLYPFWNIILWRTASAIYPDEYTDAIELGAAFYLLVLGCLLVIKITMGNKLKGNKSLHGSARWANRKDIEDMGLLPRKVYFKDRLTNKIGLIYDKCLTLLFKIPLLKYFFKVFAFILRSCGIKHKMTEPLREGSQEGVFVGAWEDPKTHEVVYLRHNGPEHVLCVAPTRSGKGVGLVNPTLLTWKESTFITDLKGELWALTSGWRKNFAHNKCIRFEPARERVCIDPVKGLYNVSRWNPFDEIRSEGSIEYYYDYETKSLKERVCSGAHENADASNVAMLLMDPKGKGLETHWEKTAYALISGAIIHLKHNLPNHCNIHTLDQMISGLINTAYIRQLHQENPDIDPYDVIMSQMGDEEAMKETDVGNGVNINASGVDQLWEDMCRGLDWNGQKYKSRDMAISAGADMKIKPPEEGGSVISTAVTALMIYRESIVSANTEVSDFRIKQLMNLNDPVSLYLVTQPTDKQRLSPLVRIMVNMVLRLLADEMQFKDGRSVKGYMHRLLLMLDEFPSLGKLDIMQESLAFIAGYGMKAYIITQDMSQLYEKYTKDQSISSNCHVQNFYATQNKETAELMSTKCGTTTIVEENVSISGSGLKTSKSRSLQQTARPLLTPDECMHLPNPVKNKTGDIEKPGKMLITVAGYPAIYGVQPLYFQDPVLSARSKVKEATYTDIIFKNGHSTDSEDQNELEAIVSKREQKQKANTKPNKSNIKIVKVTKKKNEQTKN